MIERYDLKIMLGEISEDEGQGAPKDRRLSQEEIKDLLRRKQEKKQASDQKS